MFKMVSLILALIIIGTLVLMAIMIVANYVHESIANRKLRKLEELTQEMEDRL